jgi:hypothetical protein
MLRSPELPCESLPADPGMTPRLGYDPATTALMQRLHPTPAAAAASPIAGSPHCLVVLPMLLGVEAPDWDAHHEWQWAARAVATRDQIIAARIERSPQRVTHRGEFDKFGVDLGQLHPRAGLQRSWHKPLGPRRQRVHLQPDNSSALRILLPRGPVDRRLARWAVHWRMRPSPVGAEIWGRCSPSHSAF